MNTAYFPKKIASIVEASKRLPQGYYLSFKLSDGTEEVRWFGSIAHVIWLKKTKQLSPPYPITLMPQRRLHKNEKVVIEK